MLHGFLMLLACQLIGEGLVRASALPIPGPVIGIALMLIWLAWRDGKPALPSDDGVEQTAQGLLRHFGLLFVPAGTGIVAQADVFLSHGIAVMAALIISTVVTLVATALVFHLIAKRMAKENADA